MKKTLLVYLLLISNLIFSQERFENRTFGFSMDTPESWVMGDNNVLAKNLDLLEIDDEKLQKIIEQHEGSVLLLSLYKYNPLTYKGLIPAIQINVREKNNDDFDKFLADITRSAKQFEDLYEDFDFIEKPKKVKVAKTKSVCFTIKFTMKTQNGEKHRVRSTIYVIPWKHYYFQINFTDDLLGEDLSKMYTKLVKSIRIKK